MQLWAVFYKGRATSWCYKMDETYNLKRCWWESCHGISEWWRAMANWWICFNWSMNCYSSFSWFSPQFHVCSDAVLWSMKLAIPYNVFWFELQICVICKQIHGSCTQCCKCSTYYHAMCASRAGYRMEVCYSSFFSSYGLIWREIIAVSRRLQPSHILETGSSL